MSDTFSSIGSAFVEIGADLSQFQQSMANLRSQLASQMGDIADVIGDKISSGASRAASAMGAFAEAHSTAMKGMSGVTDFADALDGFGSKARTVGLTLTAAFTAPIAAVGALGISFNALQEQSEIAFTTMLGDAGRAKKFVGELKDFAARTPFEFPDLIQATQRLLAMGIQADRVVPTLTAIGDAAAGLGGGAEKIGVLTHAIGQMAATGKVNGREMMELSYAGINGYQMLAEGMGITVEDVRSQMEKGAIESKGAIEILIAGIEKRFPNMMAAQSRSWQGFMSTIADESRFLSGALTKGAFDALKGPLASFTNELSSVRREVEAMPNAVKLMAAALGLVAGSIGPLILSLGGFAFAITNIIKFSVEMQAVWIALPALLGKLGISFGAAAAEAQAMAAAQAAAATAATAAAAKTAAADHAFLVNMGLMGEKIAATTVATETAAVTAEAAAGSMGILGAAGSAVAGIFASPVVLALTAVVAVGVAAWALGLDATFKQMAGGALSLATDIGTLALEMGKLVVDSVTPYWSALVDWIRKAKNALVDFLPDWLNFTNSQPGQGGPAGEGPSAWDNFKRGVVGGAIPGAGVMFSAAEIHRRNKDYLDLPQTAAPLAPGGVSLLAQSAFDDQTVDVLARGMSNDHAKQYKQQVAQIVAAINKENDAGKALSEGIDNLVAKHVSLITIRDRYGKQIIETVNQYKEEGREVPANVQQVYNMAVAHNAATEASKKHQETIKAGVNAVIKESEESQNLDAIIAQSRKLKISDEDIRARLGKKILENVKQLQQEGRAVSEQQQYFADLQKRHELVTSSLEDFRKKNIETQFPLTAMVAQLVIQRGEFGQEAVVGAYSAAIVKMGDAQLAAGNALDSTTRSFYDQAKAIENAKGAIQRIIKESNERLKEQPLGGMIPMPVGTELGPPGNGTSPQELARLSIKGNEDSIKAVQDHQRAVEAAMAGIDEYRNRMASTVDIVNKLRAANIPENEIMRQMAPSIIQAADAARELHQKLDPATEALVRQAKQAEASKRAAEDWRRAWQTALGNISSSFATSVSNWIFGDGQAGESVKDKRARLQKQITDIQNEQEKERLQAALDGAKKGTSAYQKAQSDMAAFNARISADQKSERDKNLKDLEKQLNDTGSKMKAFTNGIEGVFKNLAKSLTSILITGFFTKIGQAMTGLLNDTSAKGGLLGGIASILGGNKNASGGGGGGGFGGFLSSLFGGGNKGGSSTSASPGVVQAGSVNLINQGAWMGDVAAPAMQHLGNAATQATQKTGLLSGTMGGFAGKMNIAGAAVQAFNGVLDAINKIGGMVGKGRKMADDIVPNQNAFTDAGLAIVQGLQAKQAAGTLTTADVTSAKQRIAALKGDWQHREDQLSASTQDVKAQRALSQSMATVTKITSHWDDVIAGLTPKGDPNVTVKSGSKTATINFGPFTDAVKMFKDAIQSLVDALKLPNALPAATTAPIPSLAFGGFLSGTGLVFAHQGEAVLPLEELKKKLQERQAKGGLLGKMSADMLKGINELTPETLQNMQDLSPGLGQTFKKMFGGGSIPPSFANLIQKIGDGSAQSSGNQNITLHVQQGDIVIHGSDLSVQGMRDKILPEIQTWAQNNTRGFMESLILALKRSQAGVVTA